MTDSTGNACVVRHERQESAASRGKDHRRLARFHPEFLPASHTQLASLAVAGALCYQLLINLSRCAVRTIKSRPRC